MAPRVHPALRKLRMLAAGLPDSCETETWGHPTFRVGRKIFAAFEGYDNVPSVCLKQTIPDQSLLVQDQRFEVAPYVGKHGWVLVHVDELPWPAVAELVEISYRLVAGKRQVVRLDGQRVRR